MHRDKIVGALLPKSMLYRAVNDAEPRLASLKIWEAMLAKESPDIRFQRGKPPIVSAGGALERRSPPTACGPLAPEVKED
jgi:hypothetical protein